MEVRDDQVIKRIALWDTVHPALFTVDILLVFINGGKAVMSVYCRYYTQFNVSSMLTLAFFFLKL